MPEAAEPSPRPPVCWVVTDGKPGMENQCLGLAEALGLAPVIKRVAPRLPWRLLPARLWLAPLCAPGAEGDRLAPPWPDLLIATGRQTAALSVAIRRRSPATFTVQIQNPVLPVERFDLVVVPAHDRVAGEGVMVTQGALHRVTPARLAAEAARLGGAVDHLPRPRIAVLVGGSNKTYRLTAETTRRLVAGLRELCRRHGAGLMVTPSRRTGAANEALIRDGLAGEAAVIWDGAGDNPYFAYLGAADAIVVTGDSVSMISEACSTGKPVYLFALPGLPRRSRKFERFHRALIETGAVRRFTGELARGAPTVLDDTARVAEEVRRRMGRTRGNGVRHH